MKTDNRLEEALEVCRELYNDCDTPPAIRLKAAETVIGYEAKKAPEAKPEEGMSKTALAAEAFSTILAALGETDAPKPQSGTVPETPKPEASPTAAPQEDVEALSGYAQVLDQSAEF